MAKVPTYIQEFEKAEFNSKEFKRINSRLKRTEYLNNLSDNKILEEIIDGKIKNSDLGLFYINKNKESWKEIYQYITNTVYTEIYEKRK